MCCKTIKLLRVKAVNLQTGIAQMRECLGGGLSLKSCCQLLHDSAFHLVVGIYFASAPEWLAVFGGDIKFIAFEEYR